MTHVFNRVSGPSEVTHSVWSLRVTGGQGREVLDQAEFCSSGTVEHEGSQGGGNNKLALSH